MYCCLYPAIRGSLRMYKKCYIKICMDKNLWNVDISAGVEPIYIKTLNSSDKITRVLWRIQKHIISPCIQIMELRECLIHLYESICFNIFLVANNLHKGSG